MLPVLRPVIEHAGRDGHHPDFLDEMSGECSVIIETKLLESGHEEVGAFRQLDVEPNVGETRRQQISFCLVTLAKIRVETVGRTESSDRTVLDWSRGGECEELSRLTGNNRSHL